MVMSCHKKKASATNPVVRASAALALTLCALLASPTALAVDSGDIVVVSVKGEVHVTTSGAPRAVRAGSVLDPPATLRTGRDGAVELRQGATTLSVGPETLLEFPALEKRGAPIDRIVQPRGNVFYNIGKRAGRKLRIETPYLVGVVKGTQFNVAAQDETTTISLFEGLLEVHAADESGIVDLRAGEIASRQREDTGVNVLKMDGSRTPAIPSGQPAASGSNSSVPKPTPQRVTPHHQVRDSQLVGSAAESGTTAGVPAGPPTTEGSVSTNLVDVTVGLANAAQALADNNHGQEISSVNHASVDLSVDPGVDVGLDHSVTRPATDTTVTDTPGHGPPADVVDLLDGLARRRGKK